MLPQALKGYRGVSAEALIAGSIGELSDRLLTAVLGINPWAQAPSAGPRDLPVHAPALLLPRQEQIL